ncbi:sugar ABC transporter substrate-binding protein [Treponema sp.]|uniref:sugar ABC transporter substrate-binding protein n=1 Tax=Treponema sp. TaxID=166 RepID=UPI003FA1D6CD
MKKARLILSVCLFCGSILLISGCQKKKASADGYALFMTHMSNAFTIELSDAVKEEAARQNVTLTVNDAGQDVAKQISQIETTINRGVKGIVIEPVSIDGIMPAVDAAKKAGVTVVIVNQQIADPSASDCYVGVSNEDGGEMEMSLAVKDINGKGNIALLLGPMGSDAQVGRSAGYKKALAAYPDIKVVFESSAEWDTARALSMVENWLQAGKNINAIVAQNDGMAMGALKAVQDAGLQDKVFVYGLDATPDALASVKAGELRATVSQSTAMQGREAMKACVEISNGGKLPSEILVDFTLITSENISDYL